MIFWVVCFEDRTIKIEAMPFFTQAIYDTVQLIYNSAVFYQA